jgi:hypothetical protein
MKRLLAGLLLATLGCSDTAEIPTVELGGPSGARLMSGQARTPYEAYDFAYSNLARYHRDIERCLDPRGRNLYGAQVAMRQILESLRTMRSLVAASDQPRFDPYLARYQEWLRDLERDTWGGSFLSNLEQSGRELRKRFHPAEVQILAEFPSATASAAPAAQAPPAAAPPTPAPIPPDKVEPPPPPRSPAAPPATPAPPPPSGPPPAASDGASARLYFLAWDRAHDALVDAYKAKKDCRPSYELVAEALRHLKAKLSGEKADKLQIYLDYYAGIHEKTRGFTALPEKTTEKDIVDELDVAARVIRKEFNPEK